MVPKFAPEDVLFETGFASGVEECTSEKMSMCEIFMKNVNDKII